MNEEINLTGPPYIFRYRQNTERTLDEIANNYIFFPDRDSLNDPFDSSHDLVYLTRNPDATKILHQLVSERISEPTLKKQFDTKFNLDMLQELAHEKIKEFILEFGIACFSKHYMNLPLWASYANNNQGVCIQFDSSADKDFFSVLGPVHYEEELDSLEFSPLTNISDMGKIFFRKGKAWEYEKEVRLVKDTTGKLKFNKKALRNIIMGYHSEPDFIHQIIETVRDNYEHVGVYKMELPTQLGKITLTKRY
ncbi:DUF2971 domain-containing protein [Robertkochia flava]|uniref:DUF2971 domain-containing protein n=1 Tax=Robertkochia flava TaxID=3447986 RepID=UPI001CCA016F|nr:DUF2971 domain-containing protein [Robertkochia marina]